MTIIGFIEIILGLIIIFGIIYWGLAVQTAMRFFKSEDLHTDLPFVPVSVLKPLKGKDFQLEENIRSFCNQDFPEYEVLIGLNRPEEAEILEARRIVESIASDRVHIVISDKELGANRKISNLQGILEYSRFQLVIMSDSDMRVERNYLKTIVSEYQSDKSAGMVTCLYKISHPANTGAAFESLSISLDFLPSVLVAERLEGVTFGLGASMLFSKQTLAETGGFMAVADYLADDYQIGNRISNMGHRIVISKYIVENMAGRISLSEYFIHQLRWAKTVRASRPAGFFGSGITHVIPLAVLLLLLEGPDLASLSLLCLAFLSRISMAVVIYRKVIKSSGWLRWLLLLPFKDISAFIVWIAAFRGSRVIWRGDTYEILGGGKIRKERSMGDNRNK
jgi:ceramide glucosyltransferase